MTKAASFADVKMRANDLASMDWSLGADSGGDMDPLPEHAGVAAFVIMIQMLFFIGHFIDNI